MIESGGAKSKKAVTIKSHHNVGGLPEQLGLKLLEPLRDLFKDEVRELGVALGLPHEMVYRHPFPGPGLGVRILGEVKKEYADLLRRADAIFIEELRNFRDEHTGKTWYDLTSQAFAVFLPVKSVGVMGDGRTYDYVVALRAVQTSDFMTADWAELPYALLKKVSSRIINEVRGINRVTYDVSSKPPATIEWVLRGGGRSPKGGQAAHSHTPPGPEGGASQSRGPQDAPRTPPPCTNPWWRHAPCASAEPRRRRGLAGGHVPAAEADSSFPLRTGGRTSPGAPLMREHPFASLISTTTTPASPSSRTCRCTWRSATDASSSWDTAPSPTRTGATCRRGRRRWSRSWGRMPICPPRSIRTCSAYPAGTT